MLQELDLSNRLPPELTVGKTVAMLDLEHVQNPDLGKKLIADVEKGIRLGWRWPMRVQVMATACHLLPFEHGPLLEKSILSQLNWNTVLNTTASERSETKGRPRMYREGPFYAYVAFLRTRDDEYETGVNYKAHTSWLAKTGERLGEDHLLTGYLIKTTDPETSQEETVDEAIKRALKSVTTAQLQEWAVTLGKIPGIFLIEEVSTARLVRAGIDMPYAVLEVLCKLPGGFKRLDNPVVVIPNIGMTLNMLVSGVKLGCNLLNKFPGVDLCQLKDAMTESRGKRLSGLASLLKTPKSD